MRKGKYDRQIVAVAKVCGATTIYSDDKDVRTLAKTVKIDVIGLADLPLPPEKAQMDLELNGCCRKQRRTTHGGLFIKKAREIEADVKAADELQLHRKPPEPRNKEAGPLRPGTLASGAIIERVRTGTPARWASNHENSLALLKCGGYDSRGAALSAGRR